MLGNVIFGQRRLTLSIIALASKHHHDDAHERTCEEGKKGEYGSCFCISRRCQNGSTANADDEETDAELGTSHKTREKEYYKSSSGTVQGTAGSAMQFSTGGFPRSGQVRE